MQYANRIAIDLGEPDIVLAICHTLEGCREFRRERVFSNLVAIDLGNLISDHLQEIDRMIGCFTNTYWPGQFGWNRQTFQSFILHVIVADLVCYTSRVPDFPSTAYKDGTRFRLLFWKLDLRRSSFLGHVPDTVSIAFCEPKGSLAVDIDAQSITIWPRQLKFLNQTGLVQAANAIGDALCEPDRAIRVQNQGIDTNLAAVTIGCRRSELCDITLRIDASQLVLCR